MGPEPRELIENAGKAKISDWNIFYADFCRTLKMLFSLRITDRRAGLYLSYIDIEKFLSVESGGIHLDFDTYVERTLKKSKLAGKKKEVLDAAVDCCENLKGDPRLFCRGHDFIALIAWSILKFKGAKNFSDEIIARILVLLVPRDAAKFESLL